MTPLILSVWLISLVEDYDLAGFAVGAVERSQILPLPTIQAGDVVLGIASSGLHSNGFSLVRKIVARTGLSYSDPAPFDSSSTLGDALLIPTIIYIRQLVTVFKDKSLQGAIKGLAHITGGGFIENIPRVLPKGVGAEIDVTSYQIPPVFKWLMKEGNVDPIEMCRAFNCGIGMVVVVSQDRAVEVQAALTKAGDAAVVTLGKLVSGAGVQMKGLESWA